MCLTLIDINLFKKIEANRLRQTWYKIGLDAYHKKSKAQTGNPAPNMSTTFIGKSSPEELVCRQTPKSALATIVG